MQYFKTIFMSTSYVTYSVFIILTSTFFLFIVFFSLIILLVFPLPQIFNFIWRVLSTGRILPPKKKEYKLIYFKDFRNLVEPFFSPGALKFLFFIHHFSKKLVIWRTYYLFILIVTKQVRNFWNQNTVKLLTFEQTMSGILATEKCSLIMGGF